MANNQLNDKVAVITGGASGIGRACARRFSGEGARVVLGDINVDAAIAAAAQIESAGGTAHAVRLDAASPAVVAARRRGDGEALAQASREEDGPAPPDVPSP